MFQGLKNFVFYNNGFVILVLVVVFSSGSALAATNKGVRQALISSEEKIVEVDNSYIRDVNLNNHDFAVKVILIEKDDINFYVTYEFHTIELVDGAWEKIIKQNVLTINIEQLGDRDLGLYAAEELQELVNYTKNFLTEVQEAEQKKGESEKVIAKTYKGLVGRFLDEEVVTFDGYNPVVKPPAIVVVKEVQPENPEKLAVIEVKDVMVNEQVVKGDHTDDSDYTSQNNATSSSENSQNNATSSTNTTQDTEAPVMVLVGEDSIILVVNEQYQELGAVANDNFDGDVSSRINIAGLVDTTVLGTYEIEYSVSDQAGNKTSLIRNISVVLPPVDESSTEPVDESTTTAKSVLDDDFSQEELAI